MLFVLLNSYRSYQICVAHSLVFWVMFCRDYCLFVCSFAVGHCTACPSLIYGFWLLLSLWYLQTLFLSLFHRGADVVVMVRQLDLQLHVHSMPITAKVVSSNPFHDEMYSTLCYKVCQWLATGRWFSPGTPVSSTNKTDRHDITEIVLKVALNTTKQTIHRIQYTIYIKLYLHKFWSFFILKFVLF